MTNDGMTKEARMTKPESGKGRGARQPAPAKPFDLEERTALFGEDVIRFWRALPLTVITEPLIRQAVLSSTSVGANFGEADDAVSKKEFRNKIGTCKKE